MLSILSESRDIYFNLALEEYLLRQKSVDIFMLWQSDPSVVVGKHQNTFAEINHTYIWKHNIPVARRLSGGGAVYHDPGNLNFTFIHNGEAGKLVNFKRFVTPVIEYLKTMKLEAVIGTKNDLLIDGIKISGNAEHIFKQRVMHHGTLLFNADLNALREILRVVPGRYFDKAVQSNRSNVGNIFTFLDHPVTIFDFTMGLFYFLQKYYHAERQYMLKEQETEIVRQLRNDKYITPEWIYNYSPSFEINREINLTGQLLKLNFRIEKGIITHAALKSDLMSSKWKELEKRLINLPYEFKHLKDVLHTSGIVPDDQISLCLEAIF